MALKVYRLIEVGPGPYRMDGAVIEDHAEAEAKAAEWWGLVATMAVVLTELATGREDSRYERSTIDWSRVPKQWPRRQQLAALGDEGEAGQVKARIAAQQAGVQPQSEEAPPALFFNTDTPQSVQNARGASGEPGGARICPCCLSPIPDAGYEEGDRTPSGRLNDYRCMHCGKAQPQLTRRAINAQYMSMHRRYDTEVHGKKPKPQGPAVRWR